METFFTAKALAFCKDHIPAEDLIYKIPEAAVDYGKMIQLETLKAMETVKTDIKDENFLASLMQLSVTNEKTADSGCYGYMSIGTGTYLIKVKMIPQY